jgi:hypothetical protein
MKSQSMKENEVHTYGAPVCALPLFTAQMCTNYKEHSMYIRFLWCQGRAAFGQIIFYSFYGSSI